MLKEAKRERDVLKARVGRCGRLFVCRPSLRPGEIFVFSCTTGQPAAYLFCVDGKQPLFCNDTKIYAHEEDQDIRHCQHITDPLTLTPPPLSRPSHIQTAEASQHCGYARAHRCARRPSSTRSPGDSTNVRSRTITTGGSVSSDRRRRPSRFACPADNRPRGGCFGGDGGRGAELREGEGPRSQSADS